MRMTIVWKEGLTIPIDPDAVEDFSVDWAGWLGAEDSLSGVAAINSVNLSASPPTVEGKSSIVRMSGFSTPASVTLRATSTSGRVADRTIKFAVRQF